MQKEYYCPVTSFPTLGEGVLGFRVRRKVFRKSKSASGKAAHRKALDVKVKF